MNVGLHLPPEPTMREFRRNEGRSYIVVGERPGVRKLLLRAVIQDHGDNFLDKQVMSKYGGLITSTNWLRMYFLSRRISALLLNRDL